MLLGVFIVFVKAPLDFYHSIFRMSHISAPLYLPLKRGGLKSRVLNDVGCSG